MVRLFQLSNFVLQFTQFVTGGVFFRILSTLSTTMLGMLWLCPCTSSAPIRTGLFALSPITPLLPFAVNSYRKEREKWPCFFRALLRDLTQNLFLKMRKENGGNWNSVVYSVHNYLVPWLCFEGWAWQTWVRRDLSVKYKRMLWKELIVDLGTVSF